MIDNSLSEYFYALRKECPGKTWWESTFLHNAIYRALQLDRTEYAAVYAVHPFRLARIDGKALILAAYPAPKLLIEPDPDWLGIESVLAWDPVTDTAQVMGDATPQLFGELSDDANVIYASPRSFFQAWAQRRAAFAVQHQHVQAKEWHSPPIEYDPIPGALMIGSATAIRWNPSAMPADVSVVGVDPKVLNRALIRAARLPSVTGRVA